MTTTTNDLETTMSPTNTSKFALCHVLRAQLSAAVRKVRERGEEGASQAIMVLILVPVFLFAMGVLLVDMGQKNSAQSQATGAAQSVARIATAAGATDYGTVDRGRMISEGSAALSSLGMTGSISVDDASGTVTVRACKSAPTKFASLVGVREVQGCSEARASMYTLGNDGQKIKLS